MSVHLIKVVRPPKKLFCEKCFICKKFVCSLLAGKVTFLCSKVCKEKFYDLANAEVRSTIMRARRAREAQKEQLYPKPVCRKCGGKENLRLTRKSLLYNFEHYFCVACNTDRARKWRNTPNGKRCIKKYQQQQYEKWREKIKARSAVSIALKKGLLKKLPCEACGATRVHAHHENYKEPLIVRRLCPLHHLGLHKNRKHI